MRGMLKAAGHEGDASGSAARVLGCKAMAKPWPHVLCSS